MMKENKVQREKEIPGKKKKMLSELVKLGESSNTIMIVSIANLSSLQFQKIKRKIKEKSTIKVIKRSIMIKAFEELKEKKKHVEQLEQFLYGSFAVIFSQLEAFELAIILSENRTPSKIKPGQIAPQDITVEAGPTDLPAGPAISDLTKVKLKAAIEGGKIVIKESCTVAKKGHAVSEDVASVLGKLEISPFSIGLEPLAAYDGKEQKVYKEIKIDKQGTLQGLVESAARAKALAMHIAYPTHETIRMLIAKVNQQVNSISSLVK